MKIIFLDIDGVLYTEQSYFYHEQKNANEANENETGLCPIAISNLNYIIENSPDTMIVISSTWRISRSIDELSDILHANGFVYVDKIIGTTPCLSTHSNRHEEILCWLEENGLNSVEDWVAIDDYENSIPLTHLIHVKQSTGLTIEDAYTLIERFNKNWMRPVFLI